MVYPSDNQSCSNFSQEKALSKSCLTLNHLLSEEGALENGDKNVRLHPSSRLSGRSVRLRVLRSPPLRPMGVYANGWGLYQGVGHSTYQTPWDLVSTLSSLFRNSVRPSSIPLFAFSVHPRHLHSTSLLAIDANIPEVQVPDTRFFSPSWAAR